MGEHVLGEHVMDDRTGVHEVHSGKIITTNAADQAYFPWSTFKASSTLTFN